MERLTEMHFKKADGFYMKCSGHCCKEDFSCEDCGEFEKLVDRLGQIEDILGDIYDLDRLRELVEADKDGRCVVPPCKNGDAVWYITPQGELCEARVIGIWLNIYTNPQLWMEITYFSNLTGQCDFKSRIDLIFGKTVFLTKEAAEAAMGKGDE